jgi:hypothetical protein
VIIPKMLAPGMRHAVPTMIYIIFIACSPHGAVIGCNIALNDGTDGSVRGPFTQR